MGKRRKKNAKKKNDAEKLLDVETVETAEKAEEVEQPDNVSEPKEVDNNTEAAENIPNEAAEESVTDEVEAVADESSGDTLAEEPIDDGDDTLEESVTEDVSDSAEQLNNEEVTVESFLSSLDVIKSSDIASGAKSKKKKKKKKMQKIFKTLLLLVFGAVFAVSAYMIASNLREGFSANKLYGDLHDDFFSGAERTDYAKHLAPAVLDVAMPKYGNPRSSGNETDYRVLETNNQFFEEFKTKLLGLKEQNPDVYGWIVVDGTNISYPCVKGYDNDFYLDHTVTKEYNANGAIFVDSKCADYALDNQNLVFYGHNSIYPGQMFHELENFLDESFFRNNKYVTLYTLDGVYRYEIFSFFETSSYYRYCQVTFISENSFINWCNEMKTNSLYYRDTTDFTPSSKIITLSTCTNGYFTRRYSLQARLISVEH